MIYFYHNYLKLKYYKKLKINNKNNKNNKKNKKNYDFIKNIYIYLKSQSSSLS